jgi:hypothetical protein
MGSIQRFAQMAVVVLLSSTVVPCLQIRAEESDYQSFGRATVRLEQAVVADSSPSGKVNFRVAPAGTGFFVVYKDRAFLVTARHVAESGGDLLAQVKVRDSTGSHYQTLLLRIPNDAWCFHPDLGNDSTKYVDVAVAPLPVPGSATVKYFQASLLADPDPQPPRSAIVYGYPLDIGYHLKEPVPLARTAIVSMVANQPFIADAAAKKYFEARSFLLDGKIFSGNSGSPVVLNEPLDNRPALLGLVIAASESLSFAVCEPISRIRETLDRAIIDLPRIRQLPSWITFDTRQ